MRSAGAGAVLATRIIREQSWDDARSRCVQLATASGYQPGVCPDSVVDGYRRALSGGELSEFDLTLYDRTGLPVVATVYDAPPTDPMGGDSHGVGYGTTVAAARIGAYGELAERVLLDPVVRSLPHRRRSYADLVSEVGPDRVVDPLRLVLPAGSWYDHRAAGRALVWLPATRWGGDETVWVPAEFLASSPGQLAPHGTAPADGWLVAPITNGLGAGDSPTRAVAHGLLELLQRDGDTVGFRALDAGLVIDLDGSPDPTTQRLIAGFRREGIQPLVKLAATDPVCVVYCVGRDDHPTADPMTIGAIGEAAHPDRDVAIRKALLEFGSSRARRAFAFGPLDRVERLSPAYFAREVGRPVGDQDVRALEAMAAWTDLDAESMRGLLEPVLLREDRRVSYDDLPVAGDLDPEPLLALLLARLSARGFHDVLVVLAERSGMVAAKVVVPGLEVETLSHLRVGARVASRLLSADSRLVNRGRLVRASQLPVRLTVAAEERLGGPVSLDVGAVDAAMRRPGGDLYPLYREPRRHAVQRLRGGR